ncbi:unnamed protein product [Schistosoma rodhaini]|uniref:Uncharacterized protein n=1 Tax=Schistosoma rodhaini TaxID=6188 RepID=A0AA85G6L4_9TREM|nr:unnamed protein product [Schistosoma rodhaini]
MVRIHYHKVVCRNVRHYGFRPDYLPPPWSSVILDTTYQLVFLLYNYLFLKKISLYKPKHSFFSSYLYYDINTSVIMYKKLQE